MNDKVFISIKVGVVGPAPPALVSECPECNLSAVILFELAHSCLNVFNLVQ